MRAYEKLTVILLTGLLAACGGAGEDEIRFEYEATVTETCASTDVGFHTSSTELSGTAESILFDTLDKLGTACKGASVEITAYPDEDGEQINAARAEAVETLIADSYDLHNRRISTTLAETAGERQAGRVEVALKVEVPKADE